MATIGDRIEIPISLDDTRSIHNAYRFLLAGSQTSTLQFSAEEHNANLAHILARFVFQKYLRQNQVPFSTRMTDSAQAEPAGMLRIGGRSVRFFIHFTVGNIDHPEPQLTKKQVDHLTDVDDINIFAMFRRSKSRSVDPSESYFFLPPLPDTGNKNGVFMRADKAAKLNLYGLDPSGEPTRCEISINDEPQLISGSIKKIAFLHLPKRPNFSIQISNPPNTYLQITPSDWKTIGIGAETLELVGWLPSMILKRIIHDRLSIDTEYRIRYFKTNKCSLSNAKLHSIPRLLELAKQLDKGN